MANTAIRSSDMSDWVVLYTVKILVDQEVTDLPEINTLDFSEQEVQQYTLPNDITLVLFELKMNSMKALPFHHRPEYPLN
jgi:hypothetical protein